jgi:hypothetical protein
MENLCVQAYKLIELESVLTSLSSKYRHPPSVRFSAIYKNEQFQITQNKHS